MKTNGSRRNPTRLLGNSGQNNARNKKRIRSVKRPLLGSHVSTFTNVFPSLWRKRTEAPDSRQQAVECHEARGFTTTGSANFSMFSDRFVLLFVAAERIAHHFRLDAARLFDDETALFCPPKIDAALRRPASDEVAAVASMLGALVIYTHPTSTWTELASFF